MKLTDKYLVETGEVYLTGIQALVRLPLDQMRFDRRAGARTAAYISGYEGSPLGGYDLALARARAILDAHHIHFRPAVNEDLAATSVFGSQIFQSAGAANVDGVLGIWYGKGPGVDRSGDALRHANLAGSPGLCAALVLAGDDHASKSSSIPHQSDFSLYNFAIPVLYPGSIQEILDYGMYAVALSRFSGAWVGMKLVTNVCDGGATVAVHPDRHRFRIPPNYQKVTSPMVTIPTSIGLERETNIRRLDAVREFARLNPINRWSGARDGAWLGIATAGKSFGDLAQALRDLGIREADLAALGIRIAKFGMTFPVDRHFAREFAEGLETVLVIEEKRSFLEFQLREALYNLPRRPVLIGKEDESGAPLLSPVGELEPDTIARLVASRLKKPAPESVAARLRILEEIARRSREKVASRPPNFCSGCPHNRSTLLLEGQVSGGGIGCHGMGILLADGSRGYEFTTQMGGEGMPWLGMAPFSTRKHVFQNIGDGTFFHSGSLAITASVAAGVNITYRLLLNGHVAMTGGQEAVGVLPVPELTRKLEAEGVRRTVVLTDDLDKYQRVRLAANAQVFDRTELTRVLRELEQEPGVTVLIYDQECAAEKRRARSRGKAPEPVERLVIHEEVCEGCGDCVTQSNCMSLQPIHTELGQKTRIHQPSCNKDYTCALGDCPSFVTIRIKPGTGLRRSPLPALPAAEVDPPRQVASLGDGYRIVAPGIGGTGVVTINALLATAAMIEGLSAMTLDQTGLAQKGGAVVSHLLISPRPIDAAAKTNAGNADLLLGFDLLGAAHRENLKCAHPERTVAVLNTGIVPTSESIRSQKIFDSGDQAILAGIEACTRRGHNVYVDATRLAESLFGSHLAVNLFLLGAAYQGGLIPLQAQSIEEAIRLNEVAVERNLQVFLWGRKYYADAAWVESHLAPKRRQAETRDPIQFRVDELTAYQNAAYAASYLDFVRMVESREPALRDPVAFNLYKLMAYKDEYEVARLLTKDSFQRNVGEMWESVETVAYNLHPPLLRSLGLRRKLKLGAWFRWPLRAMAGMKVLRGTPLDLFGWTAHRRQERALIVWYRKLVKELLERCTPETLPRAIEIAALPDQIRGYGDIKQASIRRVMQLADPTRIETVPAGAQSQSRAVPGSGLRL